MVNANKQQWLLNKGYEITQFGQDFTVSDPLDDGDGFKLTTGSLSELVDEAYAHLSDG